jgi:hypothetical protein
MYKVTNVHNDIYTDDYTYVQLLLVGNTLPGLITVGRSYRVSFFSYSKNSDGFTDLFQCGDTSGGATVSGAGKFTVNNIAASAVTTMALSYNGISGMEFTEIINNLGFFIITSQDGKEKVAYKVLTFNNESTFCTYTLGYKNGNLTSFSANKRYNVSFIINTEATSGVSGSGTPGFLPRFVNGTQLGNSLLAQDPDDPIVTVLGSLYANEYLGVEGANIIGFDGTDVIRLGDVSSVYPSGRVEMYGNVKFLDGIIDKNDSLGTDGYGLFTDGTNVYWGKAAGANGVFLDSWENKGADSISAWSKTGIGGLSLHPSVDGDDTYYALKLSTGDLVVKTASSPVNPITWDDYVIINKNADESYRIQIGELFNLMQAGQLSMDISPNTNEVVPDSDIVGIDYIGGTYPLNIAIEDYNGVEVLLEDGVLSVESEINCTATVHTGAIGSGANITVVTNPRTPYLLNGGTWASVVIVFNKTGGGTVKKTFRVKWQGTPIG